MGCLVLYITIVFFAILVALFWFEEHPVLGTILIILGVLLIILLASNSDDGS